MIFDKYDKFMAKIIKPLIVCGWCFILAVAAVAFLIIYFIVRNYI